MQQPRDFSIYGAVDLGARQAAAQRRQQAARAAETGESGSSEASAFVFDVTEETFNTDVAERSRTTPVIVDLWADWCGPCKQLSPVLEKLANEAAGAWVLAKIDVDANPRLAQAFQAQSIPMVVAIIGGQMVDAFLGAMPESQVRQWLTQVLAVADQIGVGAPGAGGVPGADGADDLSAVDDLPSAYAEAQAAMESGDMDTATSVIEKALAETPGDPLLKSWLAQANLIKLLGNMMTATTLEMLAETTTVMRRRGIDPRTFVDVLTSTMFGGRAHRIYGDRIVRQEYAAGFAMPLALKDVRLALAEAEEAGVPMPSVDLVRDRMIVGIARGHGDLDWSALGLIADEEVTANGSRVPSKSP